MAETPRKVRPSVGHFFDNGSLPLFDRLGEPARNLVSANGWQCHDEFQLLRVGLGVPVEKWWTLGDDFAALHGFTSLPVLVALDQARLDGIDHGVDGLSKHIRLFDGVNVAWGHSARPKRLLALKLAVQRAGHEPIQNLRKARHLGLGVCEEDVVVIAHHHKAMNLHAGIGDRLGHGVEERLLDGLAGFEKEHALGGAPSE